MKTFHITVNSPYICETFYEIVSYIYFRGLIYFLRGDNFGRACTWREVLKAASLFFPQARDIQEFIPLINQIITRFKVGVLVQFSETFYLSSQQMNVVLLALTTQMMDQRINSTVYVKVLSEPMKFPLGISPSKEVGDCTKQKKNL